jgi:hypothetical protein
MLVAKNTTADRTALFDTRLHRLVIRRLSTEAAPENAQASTMSGLVL